MSLYDLFGFTQEERQAFSTGRKPKRKKKQDTLQLSLFDIVEPLSGQSVPGKGMPLPHRPQKSLPGLHSPNRQPNPKPHRKKNSGNRSAAGRRKRPHGRSA